MTAIGDLNGIEVEHLLGDREGPLVKIRCQSTGTVLVGQVAPAAAREIAGHLMEAAARAEYEADLYTAARTAGMPDEAIGFMFHLVRAGEITRMTDTREDPA